MQLELNKFLIDIRTALLEIQEFTDGMNLTSYQADSKCKAAVERKFEIIGEACTRIRDDFPETFEKITNGHHIIGFRNRLIHGYDSVDDGILGCSPDKADRLTQRCGSPACQVELEN